MVVVIKYKTNAKEVSTSAGGEQRGRNYVRGGGVSDNKKIPNKFVVHLQ